MEHTNTKKVWKRPEDDEKILKLLSERKYGSFTDLSRDMQFSTKTLKRNLDRLGIVVGRPRKKSDHAVAEITELEYDEWLDSSLKEIEEEIDPQKTPSKSSKKIKEPKKETKGTKHFFKVLLQDGTIVTLMYCGENEEQARKKLYSNHKDVIERILSVNMVEDLLSKKSDLIHGKREEV